MRKFKFNIKKELKIVAALSLLVFLIAFSEKKQDEVALRDIRVKLINIHENHFIDESDVLQLMGLSQETMLGARIDKINFRELENKIKRSRHVREADVYTDLNGNMVAQVELHRPIARLVRNDGPDGYIAEDGTVMPVSDKFTTRVLLISGSFANKLLQLQNVNELPEGKQLMDAIRMIRDDEFLNAQTAQLDVDGSASITIYPQVGGQIVEFGKPENMEMKFRKLKIFFKEILPQMGWNKYRRVNVEYEGQIVAE